MTFYSKNQRISSTSISLGQAIRSALNSGQQVSGATTNLTSVKFDGIALSVTSGSGKAVYVEFDGTVDPNIFNLGDGYACAIGVNSSGVAVRIVDPTCVSGPNYLGYCDGYGVITVAPKLATQLNIKDYGAVGDGYTDDTPALNAALSATGNPHLEILLPPGTYRIISNVTIASNIRLFFQTGSSLKPDASKTIIINGIVEANKYQNIFTGSGTISLGNALPQTSVVSVCWFGADPTGVNDSFPAFTAALNSAPNPPFSATGPNWSLPHNATFPNPLGIAPGFTILIPYGTYWITQTITINNPAFSGKLLGETGEFILGSTQLVTKAGITAITLNATGWIIENILFSHAGSNHGAIYQGVNTLGSRNTNVGPTDNFPQWASGHSYHVGDIVVANEANKYGVAYHCDKDGYSAGPQWNNTNASFTITITDATQGHVVSFHLAATLELDNLVTPGVGHLISYTIQNGDTTTAVATGVANQIKAIANYTNLLGTVTTNNNTITVTRSDNQYTFIYNWTASEMTITWSPDITSWRKFEPSWNRFDLYTQWTPLTQFYSGGISYGVIPIGGGDGYAYTTTSTGSSGSTQPIWPTTVGQTVVDGGITWTTVYVGITDGYTSWSPIYAHCINVLGSYNRIENCAIYGYPGNAINYNFKYGLYSGYGNIVNNILVEGGGGSFMYVNGNTGENTTSNIQNLWCRGWVVRDDNTNAWDNYFQLSSEYAGAGVFYGTFSNIMGAYHEALDPGVVLGSGSVWIGAYGPVETATSTNNAGYNFGSFIRGLSGMSCQKWQPNTTYPPYSYVLPPDGYQPDGYEPYIYATFGGGTSGATSPTWFAGLDAGLSFPPPSMTIDGTILWQAWHYATPSVGSVLTSGDRNTPATFYRNNAYDLQTPTLPLQISTAISNSTTAHGQITGTDPTFLAFNVASSALNNTIDNTNITFAYYNNALNWAYGGGATNSPAMSFLLNGNGYSWSDTVSKSVAQIAFPTGFFMGVPLQQFGAGNHPGFDLQNTLWPVASTFLLNNSNNTTSTPGGATSTRSIKAGRSFDQWRPNTFYSANQFVNAMPSNNHLYKCTTGGVFSGLTPLVWPTNGGTVSDNGLVWQDVGTSTDGYSVWLPYNPAISENIYYLNMAGDGPSLGLTMEEAAHRIIRIFNASQSAAIQIFTTDYQTNGTLQDGGVNTWTKTFDNTTNYAMTIKATPTDPGVTIATNTIQTLFSDGYNVKASTSSTSGAAGGDLSGTYPNPSVAAISGSTPILITPNELQWKASSSAPQIDQAQSTTGNGVNLTIKAQDGYTTHPASGGNLVLSSGAKNSTGLDGYTYLQTGNNNRIIVAPDGYVGINCNPLSMLDIDGYSVRIQNSQTPASSVDTLGNVGDISWDNNFLYVKTSSLGWVRTALSIFGPPSSFNPSALSGLQLWLRGDLNVSTDGYGNVTLWLDQSPFNRNVSQADGYKPPWNVMGGIGNNQSTISFTGHDNLQGALWSGTLAAPFTLVLIGKQISAGTAIYAFYDSANASNSVFFESNSSANTVTVGCASHSASISTNPTTAAIYIVTFNGGSSSINISAHTASGTPFNTTSSQITGTVIGNSPGGSAAGWEIAEIAVYNRALFSNEIDELNTYANTRYGITIGA